MPNAIQLRTQRASRITEARGLLDRADEAGTLSAEDQAHYDRIFAEVGRLADAIARTEQLEAEERSIETSIPTVAGGRESPSATSRSFGEPIELRGGRVSPVRVDRSPPEARAAMREYLRSGRLPGPEVRALQADSDTVGGYLRPDQEFAARLIQAIDNRVFVRGLATVFTLDVADSIGVPVLDTDISDANWTSEILTGTADTSLALGKRELRPHPLAKPIKVSNKLLRQTGRGGAVDAEAMVIERLGYKFGTVQEAAFLTGTGSQQPLGVFTASANGISTGQDVSTGNSTTSIATDGLINAYYGLKPQYREMPGTRWLFHTDAIKQIAKLKDGDGQYLWRPGLSGAPSTGTILGVPYIESRYAPNTFTTGLYVGIIGDFSRYWIVESLAMQIQRVAELYAATNETGFFGRMEVDGAPAIEEAFIRVKLG